VRIACRSHFAGGGIKVLLKQLKTFLASSLPGKNGSDEMPFRSK